MIDDNGSILLSRCDCEQSTDGHCAHVSCLLYLVEDVSMKIPPTFQESCTSVPQAWGKGKKMAEDPQPLHKTDYGRKIKADSLYSFDPRPPALLYTTSKEFQNFLEECKTSKKNMMWLHLLSTDDIDYALCEKRRAILIKQTDVFIEALKREAENEADHLTTPFAFHLKSTMGQNKSTAWFQARRYRVTTSAAYDFKANSEWWTTETLWKKRRDLSHLAAISWGTNNEDRALECFKCVCKDLEVTKCGLFVNKQNSFLGASPDSVILKHGAISALIEVKCPYVLWHSKPQDLSTLTATQQRNFCCKLEGEKLTMKRSHRYYLQVQIALHVVGVKMCYFII